MTTPIGSTHGSQTSNGSSSNAVNTSLTAPNVPTLRAAPRDESLAEVKAQEPSLRVAHPCFFYLSGVAMKRTEGTDQARRRKHHRQDESSSEQSSSATTLTLHEAPRAQPPRNFRRNWRTVDEARAWLAGLTTSGGANLPPNLSAPTNRYGLPGEVLCLIGSFLPPSEVLRWALVCRYTYEQVNDAHPLLKLSRFLGLLPVCNTRPKVDLVKLILSSLDQSQQHIPDHAFYTPLNPRVRWATTLALLGAINEGVTRTEVGRLAREAVSALGDKALTALCDLLSEYETQHRSTDVGLLPMTQRDALGRIVPVLLPILDRADAQLRALTWERLARFLPLVYQHEWLKVPTGERIKAEGIAKLHLQVLGQLAAPGPASDDAEQTLQWAQLCYADYLDYARIARSLQQGLQGGGPQTPGVNLAIEERLTVTRHIARLPAVLALSEAQEESLVPQALSLLESEVLIADGLPYGFGSEDATVVDCLNDAFTINKPAEQSSSGRNADCHLVWSMAWRFGRLARTALADRTEHAELVRRLQAISTQWPDDQAGGVIRQWFERVKGQADAQEVPEPSLQTQHSTRFAHMESS